MEPLKLVVTERRRCPRCEGWGEVAYFGQQVQCPVCMGAGSISKPVEDQAAGLEAFKRAASVSPAMAAPYKETTQEERAKYIAAVDSLIGTSVKFKLNPPKLANIEETTGRKPDFFIVSVVPAMWNLHPYVRAYPGSTEAMKFHGNKARELVAASRVLNPSVKFNCIVRVYLK